MQQGSGGMMGIMFLFRFLNFIPYIAGLLLTAAIVIWVIFGIKKFRWAKITAIVLTIVSIVIGLLSFIPMMFQRNLPEGIPEGGVPMEERRNDNRQDRKDASLGEVIIFTKSTADKYVINIT